MRWFDLWAIAAGAFACGATVYGWWLYRTRRSSIHRLRALLTTAREHRRHQRTNTFPTRYPWAPFAASSGVTLLFIQLGHIGLPLACAAGLLVGVVSYLMEAFYVRRQCDVIEEQLADSIELIVNLLQTGMTLPKSLEVAVREARPPYRNYLQDVVGRIHLGNDPAVVIRELAVQVPLESFQLFATILSVQWWSGGSLSQTLGGVSALVRHRMELDQRVRAHSVESQFSVLTILGITYGLGVIMWRMNPDIVEAFLNSTAGAYFGGAAIVAQALGIAWIAKLSRIDF